MKKPLIALAIIGGLGMTPSFALAQHKSCRTPMTGWIRPPAVIGRLIEEVRIALDKAGTIRWNGVKVSRDTLSLYLKDIASQDIQPFVVLEPDKKSPCAILSSIRSEMDKVLHCSEHHCGEGFGEWTQGESRTAPQRYP